MHAAPSSNTPTTASSFDPAAIVDTYLRTLMIPDPETARLFVAPTLRIRFTGDRLMQDPAECAQFNAGRYQWVKKQFEGTEVVAGATFAHAVVYNRGTLYGVWPDGEAFEGNRYVDRYELVNGLITHMDVWNDSAERMLMRAGLATL